MEFNTKRHSFTPHLLLIIRLYKKYILLFNGNKISHLWIREIRIKLPETQRCEQKGKIRSEVLKLQIGILKFTVFFSHL